VGLNVVERLSDVTFRRGAADADAEGVDPPPPSAPLDGGGLSGASDASVEARLSRL